MTKEIQMTNDENVGSHVFVVRVSSLIRHSSFELRHRFHAPRILETPGRLSIRSRISSRVAFLLWSTVIAFVTSNRPDFNRRSDFKYAPQPRASPMSCTYLRTQNPLPHRTLM